MKSFDRRFSSDNFEEKPRPSRPKPEKFVSRWMRIVGGEMRGQRVIYNGDPSIRPMKDRTRESVFNLLGGDMSDRIAIDLFAGTGALGIESISRGAAKAILLEYSRTAVGTILENIKRLKISDRVEVHNVDTFRWVKYIESTGAQWQSAPWVVFCCPPYAMWNAELPRLQEALNSIYKTSPVGSYFVVESENDFSISQSLPGFDWDIRHYKPAIVGVAEKTA